MRFPIYLTSLITVNISKVFHSESYFLNTFLNFLLTGGLIQNLNGSLQKDGSILVQWSSKECFKYLTGVWVRVFDSELHESENSTYESNEPYTLIPKSCIQKSPKSNSLLTLTLSSFQEGNSCNFPLKLMECKVYTIELVPNYSSLKGRVWKSNITTPPLVNCFRI